MPSLSRAERAELHADFAFNDRDHDGRITFDEFADLLGNLNAGMSPAETRIGFHEIDTDHDQVIDFDEFVAWWTSD